METAARGAGLGPWEVHHEDALALHAAGAAPLRLLDLFCGAGGAAMGYSRAGFTEIVGVDNRLQKHYPFTFVQADAMTYPLEGFDAIHASPPCQAYTEAGKQWRAQGKQYPDLVAATRDALRATGRPWVIENVPGGPLLNPTVLNGSLFGLRVRRTRWFETSFPMPLVLRPKEESSSFRMGIPVREGDFITPVGHFSNVPYARKVMGIDWMTQGELAQAIPPVFTYFIGCQLMVYLEHEQGLQPQERLPVPDLPRQA